MVLRCRKWSRNWGPGQRGRPDFNSSAAGSQTGAAGWIWLRHPAADQSCRGTSSSVRSESLLWHLDYNRLFQVNISAQKRIFMRAPYLLLSLFLDGVRTWKRRSPRNLQLCGSWKTTMMVETKSAAVLLSVKRIKPSRPVQILHSRWKKLSKILNMSDILGFIFLTMTDNSNFMTPAKGNIFRVITGEVLVPNFRPLF